MKIPSYSLRISYTFSKQLKFMENTSIYKHTVKLWRINIQMKETYSTLVSMWFNEQ